MATMVRGSRPSFRRVAAALLLAALAAPPPAAAFRDCCFVRSVPPRLTGIAFSGPIDRTLDRLERAGFQDYDPNRKCIDGLGYLTDRDAGPGEFGGISAPLVSPSFTWLESACGASIGFHLVPMGGHPNGARMLSTVIAVVDDLDRACNGISGVRMGSWGGPWFGPAEDDPALGARVREARFAEGALRVIEPVDPAGIAARWLADGGPRWIGFAVEVGDLDETAGWLRRETVPFDRPCVSILRVDPDALDGLLVEFVQKRGRADGTSCSGIRF